MGAVLKQWFQTSSLQAAHGVGIYNAGVHNQLGPRWPLPAEVQNLHLFSEKWGRLSSSSGPFHPNHFSSWDVDGRLVECGFGTCSPGMGELHIKTVAD